MDDERIDIIGYIGCFFYLYLLYLKLNVIKIKKLKIYLKDF